ncbi:MAG TPA: DUF2934 domain-containing protein [Terriglobales bacterium]|nr:DUF2934 domain-containing protein [Terriglobales bacterium]
MATPKRARATSSTSTSRTKKATTLPQAQETTALSPSQTNGNVETAIRFRAYQLYVQRGGTHGADLEDWLRAESEIRQGSAV